MKTIIRNGRIFDAVNEEAYIADILIEDGKIAAIGADLAIPGDAEIVDATGLNVYPGLVEAHGHIGLDGWAIGYEGQDYNEMNDPVTPQLRALDGINPFDYALKDAALGGVTTICSGPGSANVVGGSFAAFKTVGKCIDDMCLKTDAAMKIAFGENPKRCYKDKSIHTRMTTAAKLRDLLFRAREYMEKIDAAEGDASKMPAFNIQLNAMLPVMRGQMPLKAHAHQANDILTAIRIAKEFGVKLTLEHVTEGALIVDELVRANLPLAIGPTDGQPTKIELQNKTWETPGILSKAGCQVSIITDSPVTMQSQLRLCAGMAVRHGMEPFAALKAITINPARHIGVADRVGSLEPGKDADIMLTNGSLFSMDADVTAVFIDGRRVEA